MKKVSAILIATVTAVLLAGCTTTTASDEPQQKWCFREVYKMPSRSVPCPKPREEKREPTAPASSSTGQHPSTQPKSDHPSS